MGVITLNISVDEDDELIKLLNYYKCRRCFFEYSSKVTNRFFNNFEPALHSRSELIHLYNFDRKIIHLRDITI